MFNEFIKFWWLCFWKNEWQKAMKWHSQRLKAKIVNPKLYIQQNYPILIKLIYLLNLIEPVIAINIYRRVFPLSPKTFHFLEIYILLRMHSIKQTCDRYWKVLWICLKSILVDFSCSFHQKNMVIVGW